MKVIKKDKLIRDVAKQTVYNIADVKIIYNTLENTIFNLLSSANENEDVCISYFT